MNDELLFYRIAFACLRGMSVDLAQKILDVLPSEKDFFELSDAELRSITNSRNKITEKSYRDTCLQKADHELSFINKNKISLSYFTDTNYPQRLLNASDAPILLYSIGQCDWNSQHIVSIVGTRRCTEYGRHTCERIVNELAECVPDVITVSGLAYGTDITAHRASMKNGVPTIGVQACGLNKIYPAEHRNDAAQIIRQGGRIVSDYTSQDSIHKGNFVARNRIIAALSDCTIVIESGEKGGSLITANIATSYNRDVFAVPGRVGDEFSRGCNRLIQNNQAMLITNGEDIVNALRWDNAKKNKPTTELEIFPKLSEEEQKIVDLIRDAGDIHVNDLTTKSGIPVHKILSTLMQLDMKGVVITHPGCRFSLA